MQISSELPATDEHYDDCAHTHHRLAISAEGLVRCSTMTRTPTNRTRGKSGCACLPSITRPACRIPSTSRRWWRTSAIEREADHARRRGTPCPPARRNEQRAAGAGERTAAAAAGPGTPVRVQIRSRGGDLIRGGTDGAAARLPIGTNGDVLTVVSGPLPGMRRARDGLHGGERPRRHWRGAGRRLRDRHHYRRCARYHHRRRRAGWGAAVESYAPSQRGHGLCRGGRRPGWRAADREVRDRAHLRRRRRNRPCARRRGAVGGQTVRPRWVTGRYYDVSSTFSSSPSAAPTQPVP